MYLLMTVILYCLIFAMYSVSVSVEMEMAPLTKET
jgi:hypothetical protein